MRKFKISFSLVIMASFLAVVSSAQSSVAQTGNGDPVDLQADQLVHDESGQIITASGDVVLMQAGRKVSADKITYNLREDKVVAIGNVEFTDANGDKHYAEQADFNNALKDGFVEGLQTFLTDGSSFRAASGLHSNGNKTTMTDAFYTACETCKDNPDKSPLWQIRASEVEHDKENQSISYRNARFEIKGVPVAYTPYFSHPDGSVKRKNGFLTPHAGYKSELGAFIRSSYYHDIAPDKDMTIGFMAMSDEAPLVLAQWRQRWDDASLIIDGSTTYSKLTDDINGQEIEKKEEFRGNISVDGKWDINDKWRSGLKIDASSDDQYLRQYDFEDEDVLRNEVYLERFSGRNYADARLIAFQDLRIDENEEDQPFILPEINAGFIGDPNSMPITGGRWSFDTSFLTLLRDDDEQDMNRINAALGWQKRLVSGYGLVSVLDANLQSALYNVNDRTGSNISNNIKGNSNETRSFGYISALTSYPLAKEFQASQVVIEPIVSIVAAPNISEDDNIPNEDSLDVQLGINNIFEQNRFPGSDGVEDSSHATYGVKTGVYGNDGSYGEIFIGQSYRFSDDDNPFALGSGLDDQDSDVVGKISAGYDSNYKFDYRFQLDNHNLSSQRHEVDIKVNLGDFDFSTQYLFAKALDNADIDETREQVSNAASYYLNDNWRIYGSARHDLGVDPGLRKAGFGVDYIGQCVSLSMIGERNLTDKSSGDSGTEIMFRIGFKNLGEFETTSLTIGGDDEE